MENPVTAKQITFRAELIARTTDRTSAAFGNTGPEAKKMIAELALALSLPEPTTVRLASEQIDALMGSFFHQYARNHKEWAQPLMVKLGTAWNREPIMSLAQLQAVLA